MLVQSNVIKTRYKIIAINTHTHTHRGRCDGQVRWAGAIGRSLVAAAAAGRRPGPRIGACSTSRFGGRTNSCLGPGRPPVVPAAVEAAQGWTGG